MNNPAGVANASQHDASQADEQDTNSPAERLAFSVDEAARITGLSRDLLYDQMRTGKLAYLKVGRRRIITRQHLEDFLGNGAR
jgi:excisionase family DNA binding protein